MIELSSVTKFFVDKKIIDSVDLKLYPGEFVCLLGPSGCGKTTLLEIMAGLISPSSGTVVNGFKRHSFIFQMPSLIPYYSVAKNIEFPLIFSREFSYNSRKFKVENLIEEVGISQANDKYPYMLSGGEIHRVELCRALITEPEVIFMDEPFRSLDEPSRNNMNKLLTERWQEKKPLVVFVTHSREEAVYLGQRIVIMSDKPSVILRELRCSMPYPRDRNSDDFLSFMRQIQL